MADYAFDGSTSYTGTAGHDAFLMQDATVALTIDGLGGADYVRGGQNGDLVQGGDGDDHLYGGLGIDHIDGGPGNDILSGAVATGDGPTTPDAPTGGLGGFMPQDPLLADQLQGGDGNDVIYLDDLTGDYGYGGPGDDLYVVKEPNFFRVSADGWQPSFFENPGEGIDTIYFSGGQVASSNPAVPTVPGSLTLPANFEILLLAESADTGGGTGNALANVIIGNSLDNTLAGLDGNDAINGAGGADSIDGGNGNDLLYGGAGNDLLVGGAGNDTLFGDAGSDGMRGGTGDDLYSVDSAGDSTVEFAGEGYDQVHASVDFALPDNVENLFLTGAATYGSGNAADNAVIGNDAANVLSGGDGNDFLNGLGGNDLLFGGNGADQLWGGVGADFFRFFAFDSEQDFIGDFTPGTDKLQIDSASFGMHSITEGVDFIAAAQPASVAAVPTFLYSTYTGQLRFDGDGSGPGASDLVAILNGVPDLHASDFTFL